MEGWGERETIEEAAVALIREYLNRKGCKQSLQALDEEMPRSTNSICNRAELAQALHIAPLMRKNKSLSAPFKTIIEILVWDLIKKHHKILKEAQSNSPKMTRPSTARANFHSGSQGHEKMEMNNVDFHSEETVSKPDDHGIGTMMSKITLTCESVDKLDKVSPDLPKTRPQSSRSSGRKLNAPVMVSGLRVSNSLTKLRRTTKQATSVKEMLSASPEKVISSHEVNTEERTDQKPTNLLYKMTESEQKGHKSKKDGKVIPESAKKVDETVLQDLDEQDSEMDFMDKKCEEWLENRDKPNFTFDPLNPGMKLDTLPTAPPVETPKMTKTSMASPKSQRKKFPRSVGFDLRQRGTPLEFSTAVELRELIFGSATIRGFTEEWTEQSFVFHNCLDGRPKSLRFGLKQNKGGPCGLLAAVQAFVLKHLLFGKVGNGGNEVRQANINNLSVENDKRTSCLAEAIVEILWRAGEYKRAVVAQLSPKPVFDTGGGYRADGVTEHIRTTEHTTLKSLHDHIFAHMSHFERGKSSAVLLLISSILSRGIEKVRDDMDEKEGMLMGAHSYCTQEMVNLLTTGAANSNVFNDQVELDEGTILRGVTSRCDVGLLSLFEHYESCKVGSYLKTPRYPIWLVCSESHFSVLFCLNRDLISDWTQQRLFHLYYYDGLANQDEEIKLTVNTMSNLPPTKHPHGLIPPLELVINTKWPEAKVDWNKTEPIL